MSNLIMMFINIYGPFFFFNIFFKVWAETGEFRESNHNTMSSVTNMDNSNMNFQTPTIRRNRDKKSDGKLTKIVN